MSVNGQNDKSAQQPQPAATSSLYGADRWPVDQDQLDASHQALAQLYRQHPDAIDGKFYGWRLGLAALTGLPLFLRVWLAQPLATDEAAAAVEAAALLRNPTYARALFGSVAAAERDFEPGPTIRIQADHQQQPRPIRHFTFRQTHRQLPVIGGSVRVHGVLDDQRVLITSSYVPIPQDRPVRPQIEPAVAALRAVQAVAALDDLAPTERRSLANAAINVFTAYPDPALFGDVIDLLGRLIKDALARQMLDELAERLGQNAPIESSEAQQLLLNLRDMLGLDERPAKVEAVPIERSALALLPTLDAYRLVQQISVSAYQAEPWFVYIDMEQGVAVDRPWQASLGAPSYYVTSGEAASDAPTGVTAQIDRADLDQYISGFAADLAAPATSIEEATIAASARRLYTHLQTVCGVPVDELETYPLDNGTQQPGIQIMIGANNPTKFMYASGLDPKTIFFRLPISGSFIEPQGQTVFAPARDPEVVMHEFAHAYLWLLNPDPWDAQGELNPFIYALHEGYAMYLSRSVAASVAPGEVDQPWARAAYRPALPNGAANWTTSWAFNRADHTFGADYLVAPTIYPPIPFTATGIHIYDVGMIWARALWDLRQALGANHMDWLAVQGYSYLHGRLANFELAAECMIDADARLAEVNLLNGVQPLLSGRGISATATIHTIAETSGGALLAASVGGVLISQDGGVTWAQQQVAMAGSGGLLSGVVSIAAQGDACYAAVQMPPPATAGRGTQWQPSVFSWDASAAGATWQELNAWPNDATPLCLHILPDTTLLIGCSRGVHHLDSLNMSISQHTDSINIFPALGLVSLDQQGAVQVYAITPTSIYTTISANPWADQGWSVIDFDPNRIADASLQQIPVRPTSIVVWRAQVYVGTLQHGLWLVDPLAGPTPVASPAGMILALAVAGATLYIATDVDIVTTDATLQFQSLGLPLAATIVTCLHISAGGAALAGTLADGIWRRSGAGWQPAYAPPIPSAITIEFGERALLAFSFPAAATYQIITPAAVTLISVIVPGFPLDVRPPAPSYNLPQGEVILTLENTHPTQAQATIQAQLSNGVLRLT